MTSVEVPAGQRLADRERRLGVLANGGDRGGSLLRQLVPLRVVTAVPGDPVAATATYLCWRAVFGRLPRVRQSC
jgi:hypothetical protein